MSGCESKRTPAVDVYDGDEAWTVVVDVPGCVKDDVDITVADGKLVVEGRPQRPDMPASAVAQRRESAGGAFARTIALDGCLDAALATAKIDRGVLTVWIPKRRETKEERKIVID